MVHRPLCSRRGFVSGLPRLEAHGKLPVEQPHDNASHRVALAHLLLVQRVPAEPTTLEAAIQECPGHLLHRAEPMDILKGHVRPRVPAADQFLVEHAPHRLRDQSRLLRDARQVLELVPPAPQLAGHEHPPDLLHELLLGGPRGLSRGLSRRRLHFCKPPLDDRKILLAIIPRPDGGRQPARALELLRRLGQDAGRRGPRPRLPRTGWCLLDGSWLFWLWYQPVLLHLPSQAVKESLRTKPERRFVAPFLPFGDARRRCPLDGLLLLRGPSVRLIPPSPQAGRSLHCLRLTLQVRRLASLARKIRLVLLLLGLFQNLLALRLLELKPPRFSFLQPAEPAGQHLSHAWPVGAWLISGANKVELSRPVQVVERRFEQRRVRRVGHLPGLRPKLFEQLCTILVFPFTPSDCFLKLKLAR